MGIAVKVQLARALVAADPAATAAVLDEIEHDLGDGQRASCARWPTGSSRRCC